MIPVLLFLPLIAFAAKDKPCPVPDLCRSIQSSFEAVVKAPADHKKFTVFLSLLNKSIDARCQISGVKAAVPAYRACYDQGTTASFKNGKLEMNQSVKGVVNEENVFAWFSFANESKFPEGKKLIRGKSFQKTLDGYWAESFGGEPKDEAH